MTRGFHANFVAALTAVNPQIVVLIEIATGTTPASIRYTSTEGDYSFSGATWSARPWTMSELNIEGQETPSVKIQIADVDSELDTWLLTTDFRNQRIRRYIVDRRETAHYTSDTLRVVNHEQDGYQFTFTAEPLLGILSRINVPARVMTRDNFPGMPTEGIVR